MVDEPTGIDYVRMIAIARGYLAMTKFVSKCGARSVIE
jgi:hypothetical protein